MYPKLVALSLDFTVWRGYLDENIFGKGPNADSKIENNLELVDKRTVRDKSNYNNVIYLYPDVPNVITDLMMNGVQIAIVSSNSSKALCDRALWYFTAIDPKTNQLKPIINFIKYDEVYNASKIHHFKRINEWSRIPYSDMMLFDSDKTSQEVETELGVTLKLLNHSDSLTWQNYQSGLTTWEQGRSEGGKDKYDRSKYVGLPILGRKLGSGKFGSVHELLDDPNVLVKVINDWDLQYHHRFLDVYAAVDAGHKDHPLLQSASKAINNPRATPEQHLLYHLMLCAFELRNLKEVKQLIVPRPGDFYGWFAMTRVQGVVLWKTLPYQQCMPWGGGHPFTFNSQVFLKNAFNLILDELETIVRKYNIEHRDAHLANVMFVMDGNVPIKAHLFDWGIAARMKWDRQHYIRGDDLLLFWGENDQNMKCTPKEFREYWMRWMVKTEYEACVRKRILNKEVVDAYLKDISWWLQE